MTAAKTGKGKKRSTGRPQSIPEVEELAELIRAKSAEELAKMREQAISGLAELVPLAVRAVRRSLIEGAERRQGTVSADARYILDVVLDRVAPPPERPEGTPLDEDGNPTQTPVDELAERRAELQKYMRQQRRDADREKRGYK